MGSGFLKFRGKQIKKGSLMYYLLGLHHLDAPDSNLRKTLDSIAEREKKEMNKKHGNMV